MLEYFMVWGNLLYALSVLFGPPAAFYALCAGVLTLNHYLSKNADNVLPEEAEVPHEWLNEFLWKLAIVFGLGHLCVLMAMFVVPFFLEFVK